MNENLAEEILRNYGFKITPGRISIIRVLLKAVFPLSQYEIYEQLKHTSINKTTLYRALNAFYKAGFIHKVDKGDRIWRFGLCNCHKKGHCHPHFVCKGCGKIECLDEVSMPDLCLEKAGYIIQEQEVYVKGLCDGCA